jgi:hypothetical protein
MDNRLKRVFGSYLLPEAAPSEEHERIKDLLHKWAEQRGYLKTYKRFDTGEIPDVLRTDNDKYLFVGDAKNAKNENTSNSQTIIRIFGYIKRFASLLGNPYSGGIIAIATNTNEAANEWVFALNTLCRLAEIQSNGYPPNFQVEKIDNRFDCKRL